MNHHFEDDASANLAFDEMTDSGGDNLDEQANVGNNNEGTPVDDHATPGEVPIVEDDDNVVDYGDDPGFFECDDGFDDGHAGEWEDLPQDS